MPNAAQIVLAVLQGDSPLRIRLLTNSDTLPPTFEAGFDQLGQLDPQWVWVAERRGQIEGCIVASPCHGVALIWRLVAVPGSRCLLPLCRRFMADCRMRGVVGYMTLVDPEVKAQHKLMKIISRGGGRIVGSPLIVLASKLVPEGV